ncbi:MAG: TetR/AcrR family transcriptional repressor of nem operon [Verrucomicrobiales bacterium]|jgi:TetR/AcrR family transcriptional repressor of nem operon
MAMPITAKTAPVATEIDSRTRLLESMIDAIWERSYGAVSVDAICERAGVHKGSFYHFFKSKAALAIAALDHLWEQHSRPTLEEIFSPDRPPLARFERLISYWYQRSVACQREKGRVLGCPYFNLGAEMAAVEPEVASKVREVLDHYQATIEATLTEADAAGDVQIAEPAVTASSLFSMIEGCSMQARIHDDPERVRHFADAFGRVIGAQLHPDFEIPLS